MYTVGHSRIMSTGIHEPEERIRSEELMQAIDAKERFGLADSWLERLTGIKERRCASESVLPSDMAASAAETALEIAGITAKEIDGIIYCGVVKDHSLEPATAHIVEHKIGAKKAFSFDLSNACLGFVTGMQVMDSLIATKQVKRGLVVTGEKGFSFTRRATEAMLKTNDRKVFDDLLAGLTLGDAGAAVIMGPKKSSKSGIMGFNLESDGQYANLCYCGSVTDVGLLHTDMPGIVGVSTTLGVDVFEQLVDRRLKWPRDEIDRYIPHQVGKITFKIHSEQLGLPLSIMANTVTDYGNLISATIPFNLHKLAKKSSLQDGNKIVMAGAGSGICAGHIGMIWDQNETMH